VEFKKRGTFAPVVDLVGGGPFNLKPGEWTDDTSMALCLAASLIETGQFDPTDQMKRYLKWHETGYLSSNGRCFDIGITVKKALERFGETGDPFSGPTDPYSAGNGSLMRLAPVPIFYYPDREKIQHYAKESSRTTHGAEECLDACRLFGDMLFLALSGASKRDVLSGSGPDLVKSKNLKDIALGESFNKKDNKIKGSGYVVDCLEAALWCFNGTKTFEEAVLKAANLGDDADTTAAVCGQIAGAHYGESGIPKRWLERLVLIGKIREFADRLHQNNPSTIID